MVVLATPTPALHLAVVAQVNLVPMLTGWVMAVPVVMDCHIPLLAQTLITQVEEEEARQEELITMH